MLSLKHIHFQYESANSSFTIDIPDLSFEDGLVSCVLGTNGSGKTTVLSVIGGHLKPHQGTILLDDVDITADSPVLRPTSTVFQQIGLFPHLSVRQNMELAIEPNALFSSRAKTKQSASKIMEEFDLSEMADKKPGQLSIGQQQKVAICRSLSSKPKVLLLDEPTSALDFANISILKRMLKEIKNMQTVPVIIIVSHDLHFVLDIADNIKFIEKGRFVFDGTPKDFQQSKYYIN